MADPSCNGAYGNWQQSSQLAVQVAELTTNQHQQAKVRRLHRFSLYRVPSGVIQQICILYKP